MRTVTIGIVLAFVAHTACAGTLLVRTTAHTALNEPAAQTIHLIKAQRGQALPETIVLPGSRMRHPLHFSGSPLLGMATLLQNPAATRSHQFGTPTSVLALFRPSSMTTLAVLPYISPPGRDIVWAETLSNPDPAVTSLLIVHRTLTSRPDVPGELSLVHYRHGAPNITQADSLHWNLPGEPIDAVRLPQEDLLAVLCKSPDSPGGFVHIRNIRSGQALYNAIPISVASEQFAATPISLHAWPGQSRLVAITSGYDLEQPSGEIGSSIHVFQTNDFTQEPATLEIVGATPLGKETVTLDGDTLWIATQTPGADFAYLSQVAIRDEGPEVIHHIPYSGMAHRVFIAPAPAGDRIAIAAGRHLDITTTNRPDAPVARTFRTPIGAMHWSEEGLFVGEGARLHKINLKSGLSGWTTRLQTGRIAEIIFDAANQPAGDSSHGQSQIRPTEQRPNLPPIVTLRGAAAGEEHITLTLDPDAAIRWGLEFDRRSAPWLRVEQTKQSESGSLIRLSVDPVVYSGIGDEWIHANLQLKHNDPNSVLAPINIAVRVAPLLNPVREALWLGLSPKPSASGKSPYSRLASLLSGPPFHMSHDIIDDPVTESLHAYSVVILGLDALEKGILTRQVLLDYVVNGGALLLIGKHQTGGSAAIASWLKPLGITIDANAPVRGIFEPTQDLDLTRHWKAFAIQDGCTILTENGVTVPVLTRKNQAILALRGYGFGRVAVLASGTPIEDAALRNTANTLFAHDLFGWLASPESIIQDQDSDGLPDYVEDRNGNGRGDIGETDFLSFDTDGDGLRDGLEDLNMNGILDEGESDPRDRDTDGDGLYDGADFSPLPAVGTPQLARIVPASGPAEGGLAIELEGLNFPSSAMVWIGGRRAGNVRRIDSTRITAIAPPVPSGAPLGPVSVLVADAARDLSTRLPDGFAYTPRSSIGLRLHSPKVTRLKNVYRGEITLQLEAEAVALGFISFRILVAPSTVMDDLRILPSQQLLASNRRMTTRRLGQGLLLVSISQGRLLSGNMPLATIHWSASPNNNRRELEFKVDYPNARVRLGGRPQVSTKPLLVPLATAAAATRRRSPS